MNGFAKARRDAGFNQAQIAEYLDVTTQTVSYWENGRRTPTLSKVVKLSELYGCPIEKLLKED